MPGSGKVAAPLRVLKGVWRRLMSPRLHVPSAVAVMLSAFTAVILDALHVTELTPVTSKIGVVAAAVGSFLLARAVLVRSSSRAIAQSLSYVWPVILTLGAAALVGVSMALERPHAELSFAGRHESAVVAVVALSVGVGILVSALLVAFVWGLDHLRPSPRGASIFSAVTWALASGALLANGTSGLPRLAVGAAIALTVVNLLSLRRSRSERVATTSGPYRGSARTPP